MESTRLAALGEMSAGMAHELNTPLATITLQLENLREALPQELVIEFPQCSEWIQSQLDRVSNCEPDVAFRAGTESEEFFDYRPRERDPFGDDSQ